MQNFWSRRQPIRPDAEADPPNTPPDVFSQPPGAVESDTEIQARAITQAAKAEYMPDKLRFYRYFGGYKAFGSAVDPTVFIECAIGLVPEWWRLSLQFRTAANANGDFSLYVVQDEQDKVIVPLQVFIPAPGVAGCFVAPRPFSLPGTGQRLRIYLNESVPSSVNCFVSYQIYAISGGSRGDGQIIYPQELI